MNYIDGAPGIDFVAMQSRRNEPLAAKDQAHCQFHRSVCRSRITEIALWGRNGNIFQRFENGSALANVIFLGRQAMSVHLSNLFLTKSSILHCQRHCPRK